GSSNDKSHLSFDFYGESEFACENPIACFCLMAKFKPGFKNNQ
ncbi:11362_t:CDS:1, partial [Gigaspora rosea]